jgi:hypothetical protein
MKETALSFARDIRPMFTDEDVEHMKQFGMDLSKREDVAAHADNIYKQVSTGGMPPPGSGTAWTQDMCLTLKAWQEQGCPP